MRSWGCCWKGDSTASRRGPRESISLLFAQLAPDRLLLLLLLLGGAEAPL